MYGKNKSSSWGLILALIFLTYSSLINSMECSVSTTDEKPFYVSDEYKQGSKVYENLRSFDSKNKEVEYLPKGSIVYAPPELFELSSEDDFRIAVKVLSTPTSNINETLLGSKYYDPKLEKWFDKSELHRRAAGLKGKKRAKKGSKGYIPRKALAQVDDYTFLLKNDSKVYKTPSGDDLNGKSLSFKMIDGKFQVKSCCKPNPDINQDGSICVQHYVIDVKDKDNNVIESFSTNIAGCELFSDILPVPNEDILPISQIINLVSGSAEVSTPLADLGIENLEIIPETNKWSGSKKLTKHKTGYLKFPIDDATGFGPFNSFHYNKDDKGNSDIFIKPLAGCAFMQVLKSFEKKCSGKGCQVMFGDMFHRSNWKNHKGHYNGRCIDIRPFRKKDDIQNQGLTHSNNRFSRYDREKTEKFLRELVKAGATPIHFNDSTINKKFKDAEYLKELRPDLGGKWKSSRKPSHLSNHDNHIHVCFPENAEVKKTCKDGVK